MTLLNHSLMPISLLWKWDCICDIGRIKYVWCLLYSIQNNHFVRCKKKHSLNKFQKEKNKERSDSQGKCIRIQNTWVFLYPMRIFHSATTSTQRGKINDCESTRQILGVWLQAIARALRWFLCYPVVSMLSGYSAGRPHFVHDSLLLTSPGYQFSESNTCV